MDAQRNPDNAVLPLDKAVLKCISQWPEPARRSFSTIRHIVLDVASRTGVGTLEETLKWGQPSWLPRKKGVGATLRCNWSAKRPDHISLFVHCGSRIIEMIQPLYPTSFQYEGQRGLHMVLDDPLPIDAIDHCVALTLTYHRKSA